MTELQINTSSVAQLQDENIYNDCNALYDAN